MMNEIEVSIGGIVEERRVNTMKRIKKLPLSAYDRDIIDSIFCCMQSRNAMTEKLAYYAGLSDALEFLKQ